MSRLLRRRLPLAAAALLLFVALPFALLSLRSDDTALEPPVGPLDRLAETIAPAPVSAQTILHQLAARPAADKVQPELRRALAEGRAPERTLVTVQSAMRLDLSAYDEAVHQFSWPAGEQVAMAWIDPADAERIAGLPGVVKVQWSDPDFMEEVMLEPPVFDPDLAPAPWVGVKPAELRATFDAAPSWAETEALLAEQARKGAANGERGFAGDGANDGPVSKAREIGPTDPTGATGTTGTDGWFDSRSGHAAAEAWEMGFTGKGVKVAVIDTSTDFGHPDLHDAWATYDEGHTHAGWPIAFDPVGAQRLMQDETGRAPGNRILTAEAASTKVDVIRMSRTITPTLADVGGREVYTGCMSATGRFQVGRQTRVLPTEEACDWVFPDSRSGKVLVGMHHDWYAGRAAGKPDLQPNPLIAEYPSVLLVDADTPGVYDTVYVDIDVDHDFTNDKPMTKASPLGWRDVTGDGIADLSAGLLYWIADGQTQYPGSWLVGFDGVPDAGKYVAIHTDMPGAGGGHGTLCASNVASRGRLGVPDPLTLSYRDLPGDGKPNPMNPGMGPDAEVVGIGYSLAGGLDQAWRFALLGADILDPSDDVQITSNSYGNSGADDEGWNNPSRMHDYYVRTFNPSAAALYSTGNGGSGYGTLASPAPMLSLNIAASTQMGSTGWDSIWETSQITYGDITPFSNRGPSAVGNVGPHVAADGAYAAGARLINTITTDANRGEDYRGGHHGNQTWGGTSRSAPIAAGLLANVYQAFNETHGRWPTYQEVRAIAMAGARFNGYDVMTMGAGVMDGGDMVRIASGAHGVFADPPEWNAGDYRGKKHEAFAKVAMPGSDTVQTFALHNYGANPITVDLSAQRLRRVKSQELELTTVPITEETEYAFNAADYLIELQRAEVPEGTELMQVEWILPLDGVDAQVSAEDPDGNQRVEAYWRMGVFQHTDWNDDQLLWEDKDGDGHVDKVLSDDITGILDASGGSTREIDWENSEIQEGEYVRFSYNTNQANNQAVYVQHPLERWSSGIYIGFWHHGGGRNPVIPQASFKIRVTYFDYEPWPLVGTDKAQLTVPPAADGQPGTATFDATLSLPEDAPLGAYQGAIFADYPRLDSDPPHPGPGGWELDGQRVVIPVIANVARTFDWRGPITFGGPAADPDAAYNNGAVSGRQSWSWRPESGDWRFFFFDVLPPPSGWGTRFVLQTEWTDASEGQADIDTQLFGPAADRFSDPSHAANQPDEDGGQTDVSDPDFYGPYTLRRIASSPRLVGAQGQGAGRWPFNTSTGTNKDLVPADVSPGLHEIMLDHVLHSGLQFEMPFETTVGSIRWAPELPILVGEDCTTVTVVSDFGFEDVQLAAAGLTLPLTTTATVTQSVNAGDPSIDSWAFDFAIPGEAHWLEATLAGPEDGSADLDLYVLLDANGDGSFEWPDEVVGSSQNGTASGRYVSGSASPAGSYRIAVHGQRVEGEAKFSLEVRAIYGTNVLADGLATTLEAGVPATMRVCADDVTGLEAGAEGVVLVGPAGAQRLVAIPLQWQPEGWEPPRRTIYLPELHAGR